MEAQQFEEIYREHYPRLRRVANQLIHDDDASHDLVQEVFVKFWHKQQEVDAVLNVGAYLYRAVVNASYNHLSRHKPVLSNNYDVNETSATSGPDMETRELQQRIRLALAKLPPKCRIIFSLSRFEERKNKEIAELLGLSVKTVENQMGIALRKMREYLKAYLGRDMLALGLLLGPYL